MLEKEEKLEKVQFAMTLDKHIKSKGKKRKVEDQESGKVHFRWFNERKR